MNFIGWLSSVLLAACGFPLSLECYIKKSCDVGYPFLLCWGFGEILVLFYVIYLNKYPLIFNYSINILFLIIIFYYKINTKKT